MKEKTVQFRSRGKRHEPADTQFEETSDTGSDAPARGRHEADGIGSSTEEEHRDTSRRLVGALEVRRPTNMVFENGMYYGTYRVTTE